MGHILAVMAMYSVKQMVTLFLQYRLEQARWKPHGIRIRVTRRSEGS